MNLQNEHSSRHLRLRWHLSANALQLKALKLAPPNSLRSDQYRQLDYQRALLEAELRLQEEIRSRPAARASRSTGGWTVDRCGGRKCRTGSSRGRYPCAGLSTRYTSAS